MRHKDINISELDVTSVLKGKKGGKEIEFTCLPK